MNSLRSLVIAACCAGALSAQGIDSPPPSVSTRSGVLPVAGTVDGMNAPLVPAPPRSAQTAPPPKQTPALHFTPGAAPDLAPGTPTTPGVAGPLGGGLVVADNFAITPSGASISRITEPTTIIHRDTALYTANWFAATSRDAGQTWAHMSPYTMFPASDGGFCCDQYALYVPGTDTTCMFIWLLQYGYSATTGLGRQRVAVAVGRNGLRQRQFHYYDLGPGLAGFPANRWFDFPHVSRTNTWFYLATNVFDQNSVFQGTAVIRLSLADMRNAAGANFNIATTNNTQPGSHRLSDGATTTMYYGTHARDIFGAPLIRIFAWDDGVNTPTARDRNISAWYTGVSSAIGPDGRDWLGRDDHRILGCYFASGAVTFMWGSNAGGPFPRPFVRIVGFAPATNFSLVGEASVWNPTIGWAYPSVAANAAGNVGGTICFGGGSFHPGTATYVVDGLSGWAPLTNVAFAMGNSGPAGNAWGDYLSATRHPQYPNTYVGTGFSIDANGNSVPRYAWFGRQNDLPNFATVNVTSIPVAGVPISVDVLDRGGNQNGVTNFTRTYSGAQGMTWTAPAQATVGNVTYQFERWRFNADLQPVGQLDLVIADLQGVVSNTVEARYVPVRRTLTVTSTPTAGAVVTASLPDLNNRQRGTTTFTLEYGDGVRVILTADPRFGSGFDRWVLDGVAQPVGQLDLFMRVSRDHQAVAQYREPMCGSFTSYGASCMVGFGYRHVASTSRATCGPWIGDSVNYGVELAWFGSIGGVLLLGASRTVWNGIPLPFQVPGQQLGCNLYNDMLVTIGFGIDTMGRGGVGLTLPTNVGLIGARLQTQCVSLGGFGFHQFSNGIETLIGGLP